MRSLSGLVITALLFGAFSINAAASDYSISKDNLHRHVSVLAHDSLEGRQIGEPGEWKAAQYIASVMAEIGLLPMGDDGTYFQAFDFIKRIDFGPGTRLIVNGRKLLLGTDYEPLKQSASIEFNFGEVIDVDYGIKVDSGDGDYNDYRDKDVAGKAVLIRRFAPSSEDNPHVDFDKYAPLVDKIRTAIEHKASAVFFITPEEEIDSLADIGVVNLTAKEIPIVLIRRDALVRLGLDATRPVLTSISGQTELVRTRDTAYNVIGYRPGATDTTILLGAHYDHLGWGTAASLYRGDEKAIHNGADDNASGVAAVLEMARFFGGEDTKLHHSLMLITFTGEEAGLLGSGNFARNMTIDQGLIRMMLNVDMIGRLKDQENTIAVLGTGTCTEFKTYFDSLTYDDLEIAKKESGSGPSDHTIFYNRGIPSIQFFTGAHSDYHRPSDDTETLDFEGLTRIGSFMIDVTRQFDTLSGPLTFQKTKDPGEGKRRSRFSVTLGVMPDYVAEVKGLKVDGVTPDRPAERAGIVEGDIVVQMGEYEIGDIYDYMNALGKFRKGDSCTVIIIRGEEQLSVLVQF